MNDLVERLRDGNRLDKGADRLEAADRIEQLILTCRADDILIEQLQRQLSEKQNATIQVRGKSIPIENLVK